ncbi:MAG: hypothetical protein LM577_03990 [Thermoproteaceae archaeon]|nr:hypothetical protein [Thermoproteaceae archaeon]
MRRSRLAIALGCAGLPAPVLLYHACAQPTATEYSRNSAVACYKGLGWLLTLKVVDATGCGLLRDAVCPAAQRLSCKARRRVRARGGGARRAALARLGAALRDQRARSLTVLALITDLDLSYRTLGVFAVDADRLAAGESVRVSVLMGGYCRMVQPRRYFWELRNVTTVDKVPVSLLVVRVAPGSEQFIHAVAAVFRLGFGPARCPVLIGAGGIAPSLYILVQVASEISAEEVFYPSPGGLAAYTIGVKGSELAATFAERDDRGEDTGNIIRVTVLEAQLLLQRAGLVQIAHGSGAACTRPARQSLILGIRGGLQARLRGVL